MSNQRKFWILAPFLFLGAVLLFGWMVMLLWNAILPDVLGVKALNYWQALGLLVLCRLLVGGIGGGRGRMRSHKGRKDRRWARLDDAERERLRDAWQYRCDKRDFGGRT
ncbi:MAG TPA: hypothetical protein PK971_03410 [Saprospiraceae bacterium]|nr:hypothetical protein [Saprospiraceae bacterium]